jgi:hypothetical protein
MARIPHGYHDASRVREELAAAGFAAISVDTVQDFSRALSAHGAAIAYCQGTPVRNEIETRDASRLEEATRRAAEWLARRFGSGPIEGLIQAHVFEAASAGGQRVPTRGEGGGSGGAADAARA